MTNPFDGFTPNVIIHIPRTELLGSCPKSGTGDDRCVPQGLVRQDIDSGLRRTVLAGEVPLVRREPRRNLRPYRRELSAVTCPKCVDTGIKLNPRVYVEWGNKNFGTLSLTTTCECQTKTTTGEVDAADSLTGYSSDHNPTTDFQS